MSQPLVIEVRPSDLPRDRLGLTIILATAFHALLILGITFGGGDEGEMPPLPNIEVTLVTTQSDKAPEDADYLAQANQEGGGNTTEKVRPQTIFPSMVPEQSAEMTSPTPPVISPPSQQRASRTELMTVQQAETDLSSDVLPEEKNESKEVTAAQLISRSMDIASLEAEISNAIQAYAQEPRRKRISANTREHKYAAYMDAWRQKVERQGNLSYPGEAKRKNLKGSLVLDVALNPNGTIRELKLLRSSGYKVLDDFAIRVVRDSAPYAPFTDAIKKETDVLHITRTWRFSSGGSSVGR